MTWTKIGVAFAVSVALVACEEVKQGVLQPIPPLAGLRYVNLVNDTSAVDFRIINFVGEAPSAGAASFRTGGQPFGIATNYLPPHWPVEAGRDVHIRVFMNSEGGAPGVVSQQVFDTTCTFSEGQNYTFYLYGSARGAAVHALVTTDAVPALSGTQIGVRAINLASSLAPTLTGANVDVDVLVTGTALPTTPQFGNLAYLGVAAYQTVAANATLTAYISAPGTRTSSFSANLPAGVAGTATVNPVAGSRVAGSAISAVVVPASVTGSTAPQTTAFRSPTVIFLIDRQPPLTAP